MLKSLSKRHIIGLSVAAIALITALLLPEESTEPQAKRQTISLDLSNSKSSDEPRFALAPETKASNPEPKVNPEPMVRPEPVASHTETQPSEPVAPHATSEVAGSESAAEAAKHETASPEIEKKRTKTVSLEAKNDEHDKALASTSSPQAQGAEAELLLNTRYALPLDLPESLPAEIEDSQQYQHQQLTVKSGDSLALLFKRAGLSAKTLYRVDNIGGEAKQLRKLHPGDKLDFYLDDQQQLQALHYPLSNTDTLIINKVDDGFSAKINSQEVEIRTAFAQGFIKSSFWNAAIEAKMNDGLIMSLATVFGWDVDFALDIRWGDNFTVLYEEQYIDGQYSGTGNILAAEFVNQGEVFTAIRHQDGNYYSPEGKPMRKAFLRAPVNFKYISSSFNPRRLHPVTGKVRPHNGIDYAAKVGTPVVSAGDGKVIKSGYSKYNGNYIFIQHSTTYVTKYLHLHKRYVKTGQRVKQGKKIGSVGATGRVTGPHLHYEFLVNGSHRNPRTVKLPDSKPLKGDDLKLFLQTASVLDRKLSNTKRILLAMR